MKDQVRQSQIKALQKRLKQVKTDYLLELIALGYIFEQKGSYSDTQYWAIHSSYYTTFDERWDKETEGELVWDGTIFPEMFPKGAFIRIDSVAESETVCPETTEYFLYENRCSIEYLC